MDTDEDMKPVVYDLSKGLAEVLEYYGEPIVQFIHQSVQDYLLEKGFQVLNNSSAGNVIGHGHLWISRSCIEYLFMEEVQDSAVSLGDEREASFAEIEGSDSLGLFRYSSTYWLSHIQSLEDAGMSQDDLAALSTKALDVTLQKYWVNYLNHDYYFHRPEGETTLLHIMTGRNLINIMRAVLTQTVRADQTDSKGQTSLSIAAEKGHAILVELLLGRDDVDVNHKDILGNTPLSLAATHGYEALVQVLMNREDVDLNSVNRAGRTPLSEAARYEYVSTVRTLLNKEAVDVNHKDVSGDTPLHLAAEKGRTAVVELLLQHNADIDVRDKFDFTPLSLATSKGDCKIVNPLLQRTNNADSIDESGRTPLSLAASKGHYEVVKLLLQRTSNADSIDNSGRTPLSYACEGGYMKIVEEFLNRSDVDVDSRDIYGRSVLSWAINNYFGRSALSWVIKDHFPFSTDYEDSKDVVDLLLSRHDILINKADEEALEKFKSEERYLSSFLT